MLTLCYRVLRSVLQLAVLRVRSDEFKDLEIVVLRTVPKIVPVSSQNGASTANSGQDHGLRKLLKRLDLLGKTKVVETRANV